MGRRKKNIGAKGYHRRVEVLGGAHFILEDSDKGRAIFKLLTSFLFMLNNESIKTIIENCIYHADKIMDGHSLLDDVDLFTMFEKYFFSEDKTFTGSITLGLNYWDKIVQIEIKIMTPTFYQKGGDSDENRSLFKMFGNYFAGKDSEIKKICFHLDRLQHVSICNGIFKLGSLDCQRKCCDKKHDE